MRSFGRRSKYNSPEQPLPRRATSGTGPIMTQREPPKPRSQSAPTPQVSFPAPAKLKTSMEIEKVYEPGRFEPRWAQWWVESGIYTAKYAPDRKMFSLVIPPPNVTG